MIRHALILLAFMGFGSSALYAQGIIDLVRYSRTSTGGTARIQALGGAGSAVGADFSAGLLNPAGFGLYRRNEVHATAGLFLVGNTAEYIGARNTGNRTSFSMPSLGLVYHQEVKGLGGAPAERGLKSFTIGFGYAQLENYNRQTTVSAFNPFNSLGDSFAYVSAYDQEQDFFLFPEEFDYRTFAAWNAFYIDTIPGQGFIYEPVAYDGQVQQSIDILERGRMNRWNLNIAGNFGDRVYVGFGINIDEFSYSFRQAFTEEDINNRYTAASDTTFAGSVFSDQLEASGFGVGFSFGMIAQPLDFLRLAAAVHSPTWTSITEQYSADAVVLYDDGFSTGDGLQQGDYRYNMRTPLRATFGLMALIGQYGFISADVEYIDYSSATFTARRADQNDGIDPFVDFDQVVDGQLTQAWNYRMGAELRMNRFYLRGGYSIFGNPYNEELDAYEDLATYNPDDGSAQLLSFSTTRTAISFGLGYRWKQYFVDATYVLQQSQDKFRMYNTPADVFLDDGIFVANPELLNGNPEGVYSYTSGTLNGGLGKGFGGVVLNEVQQSRMLFTVGYNF